MAHWKTVWVTGASSGLGHELAKLLVCEAENVAVSARSEDILEDLANRFDAIAAYPVEVDDAESVANCVNQIEETFGPIDLAVLNAGTWQRMDAENIDLKSVRRGFEVNYMGVIHAVQAVLPGMIKHGRGHIAITASVAGYRGLPKSIAYGPTKAALINLAETLKVELAPLGIDVSLVNPGFVDTPMTRGNPFPMPGLMSASNAAQLMLKGLKRRQYEVAFPRGFVFVMKVLRLLPSAAYFWLIRRFVHKK